ncbi:uncharacterized protein C8orf74-like isoform X2 [Rhinoraja longicauda]
MSSLTAEDVWRLLRLQKEDGRQLLTKLLNWDDFDEERDLKPGILLDYLYNTIIFAAEKGFPWPSVAAAAGFSHELLCETKGKTIQEAIGKLWDKCEKYQNKLNSNYLQHLANYLLVTFFKHYHLYQFVLCKDREVDQTIHELEVHVPQEIPPLKNGTDVELWNYQQQLAKLSEAEAQLRNDMSVFREARLLKNEREMNKFYMDLRFQNKEMIEKTDLEEIVKAAYEIQMAATSEILQKQVETTFQILDLKLQKITTPFQTSKLQQSSTKKSQAKLSSKKK